MEALPELKCQRILYIVLIGEEYITIANEISTKLILVPGSILRDLGISLAFREICSWKTQKTAAGAIAQSATASGGFS